jgi:iron-sulfur cluster repair protein YtfE (RIC family)
VKESYIRYFPVGQAGVFRLEILASAKPGHQRAYVRQLCNITSRHQANRQYLAERQTSTHNIDCCAETMCYWPSLYLPLSLLYAATSDHTNLINKEY